MSEKQQVLRMSPITPIAVSSEVLEAEPSFQKRIPPAGYCYLKLLFGVVFAELS